MTKDPKERLQQELLKKDLNYVAISQLANEFLDSSEGVVRFSVDAQHINRLGLELVGKQETALSELIKNAYDADALKVKIDFKGHTKPGGKLIICDDGAGMDEKTIKSSWMRLSTNQKVKAPISPQYGRLRAGKKGIGRFAVQRLGKKLILETEVKGSTHGTRVIFDWDKQFQSGKDIGTVWSQIKHYPKEKNKHGTRLVIDNLRDRWTERTIERVWKSVLLLQPPYKDPKPRKTRGADGKSYEADTGFGVEINGTTSQQHRKQVSIETAFLDYAAATIIGSIDKDGKATYRVVSKKYDLDEKTVLKKKFRLTGKVHLEIKYFIYSSDVMPGTSTKSAANMGHKYGGVRLYRDGFRVLPYGESKYDDWLNLSFDAARRNTLLPENNQNFFGHVEISQEDNPRLQETSSREGLVENEAFEELRIFTRECLDWAVNKVGWVRDKKITASQKDFKSKIFDKSHPDYSPPPRPFAWELMEDLKRNTLALAADGKEKQAKKIVKEFTEIVKTLERTREDEREETLKYESMLRILASLGLSISIFSHEIKGAFDIVNTNLILLRRQIQKIEQEEIKNRVAEKSENLNVAINKVFDLGNYLSDMMDGTSSRTLKSESVRGVLDQFVKQFGDFTEKRSISFELGKINPSGLRTCRVHRSEIDSVLFNFLTNSIKALDESKQKDRRVKLSAFENKEDVVIRFEDNGHGVPDRLKDKIFDAFFTTSTPHNSDVAGSGTGLGLKIVHDIALSYGGQVSLEEPSKGFKCCFEFRIPSNEKKVARK